ncbi:MAG TPA: alginate export family protein [Pyrinomonadaceae bacterium]|nr:alginate export family protein [Pyrinomonadaceae bacterium]
MSGGGFKHLLLALSLFVTCAAGTAAQQPSGAHRQAAQQVPAPAPASPAPPAPPFKQLRYEEDWSHLRDPSRRSAVQDKIKYIPLGDKEGWYLSIGGEARGRFERFANSSWGQDPEDNNGHLLQRYMLHADLRLGTRARVFAQIKSGLEDGRRGGARPTDEDKLDLHQAFFDLKLGNAKNRQLLLRAGRQEMSFGSSRLIGVRESPNVRQSFDGLRATLDVGVWRVDGFVTKPVETDRGFFDDASDSARTFWGVYAVRPLNLLPGGNADLYYLGIDRKRARFEQGASREVRHSAGIRLWGGRSAWDYNYEFVYQWGTFGRGRIRAWTIASDNGYTLSRVRARPRLGLKADVTSGDRNPADPNLQTFNALFPKGAYFGEIALVGPSNHIDLHPSLELRPAGALTLTAEATFFWRESLRDGIYGNAINLLRPGSASDARFVGSQPSVQAEWRLNRHLTWAGVFSCFFAGSFVSETGPGRQVRYITSWLTYKF